MSPQGVYPSADACEIGEEISSTYEGRHVTLYADNISHGSQVDYVTKGYGVWFEEAVGMPFVTQAAGDNNLHAIDTEGIWCVDVYGYNDAGACTVIPGEKLYINTTTGLVSKINNVITQLPFGYALGNVGSGATERIAVKVHYDPNGWTDRDMYGTWADGIASDDVFKLVVSDAMTIAGGINRALAIEYTTSGTKTGTAQINAISIDAYVTADIPDVMLIAIYTGAIADKTMEKLFGISMYFEDFGNALDDFVAIDIGYNSPHDVVADRNCFFRLRQHNTVQASSAIIRAEGQSAANFLVQADTMANMCIANATAIDGETLMALFRVEIAGVEGYVPVFAAEPT